jgi:hypothetical protein
MPSSYTPLGIEKMLTGEQAGLWGDKTNNNWDLIEQIAGGYTTQAVNGTGDTPLAVTDGGTGASLATRVIKLTGTITGNITVSLPLDVQNFYFIENGTSGVYTVEVQYTSGSGTSVTWGTADKGWKIIYAKGDDGTNPNLAEVALSTDPAGSTTQVQYNNAGAFGGDANLIWVAADGLTIDSEKEIRLGDNTGSAYVGLKAPATITSDTPYTLTLPVATGAVDQVLTTNGSGVLSFVDNTGGTDWQTVITAATKTAVAGEGYFIDTTSNVCNLTLPAGVLGDEVSVVDYAGTFDSNNLTVTPGSGEKIQGGSADATLTVATERAGFTLAYSGATQGWLLKNK